MMQKINMKSHGQIIQEEAIKNKDCRTFLHPFTSRLKCLFLCFKAEGNQNRLQEEFQRMMFQLEEERKVTENLSKSLELEKRKVESLEQRAKHNGSSRGSREAENSKRRCYQDHVLTGKYRVFMSISFLGPPYYLTMSKMQRRGWVRVWRYTGSAVTTSGTASMAS